MSMQQQHQITEEQLDAIYKYLAISYDGMSDKEQKMWTLLLAMFDPEFDDDYEYENENN